MNEALYKLAIEELTREIEKEPSAVLYKERGRMKMLLGDKEGATQDMISALAMDPEMGDELTGSFQN